MKDEQQQDTEKVAQSIDVPLSVIQRFFSKKETLTAFLSKITKDTTHAMLDVSLIYS